MKVFAICFVIIAAVAAIGEGLEKNTAGHTEPYSGGSGGDHTEKPANGTTSDKGGSLPKNISGHSGSFNSNKQGRHNYSARNLTGTHRRGNSSEGTSSKNIGGQGKIDHGNSGSNHTEKPANGTTSDKGGSRGVSLPKNISGHSGSFYSNRQGRYDNSAKNLTGTHHRGTHRGSSRGNHFGNNHGGFHRAVGSLHKNTTGHSRSGHTRNNKGSWHYAGRNSHRNGTYRNGHFIGLTRNHPRGRKSHRIGSHKNVSGRPATLHGTSSRTLSSRTTNSY